MGSGDRGSGSRLAIWWYLWDVTFVTVRRDSRMGHRRLDAEHAWLFSMFNIGCFSISSWFVSLKVFCNIQGQQAGVLDICYSPY